MVSHIQQSPSMDSHAYVLSYHQPAFRSLQSLLYPTDCPHHNSQGAFYALQGSSFSPDPSSSSEEPTLDHHDSTPSTPTSEAFQTPAQTVFETVLDVIKEYEFARRECRMDPMNQEKCAALESAADTLDSVLYHYTVGNLTREAYLLLEFFMNMLSWETNIIVTQLPNASHAAAGTPDPRREPTIPNDSHPAYTVPHPDAPTIRLHSPGLTA